MALIQSLGYRNERSTTGNKYGMPQYGTANTSCSHSGQFQGGNAYTQHRQQFTSYPGHSNRANFHVNHQPLSSNNQHSFRLSSTSWQQKNFGQQENYQFPSGIGFVSAVSKYEYPTHTMNHSSINNNRLGVDNATNNSNKTMTLHDTQSMPISPIRQTARNKYAAHDQSLNLPLNATQNRLNFSNMATSTIASMGNGVGGQFGNFSRLSVQQFRGNEDNNEQIRSSTQVAIIGFPPGEAQFIHRKFRSYGTILISKLKSNTLFLEYEHAQNATRAMAENAKWIQHGNHHYMIVVIYAESTDLNTLDANHNAQINKFQQEQTGGGRFLNLGEMYQHNGIDGNIPQYFGQHHNNQIERPPAIQSGTKHIFWKIFNFVTSGW